MKKTKESKLPNLEESLTELTTIIEKMEHDDLKLEQSLENFERGISLIKHSQKILLEAEQKVQILMNKNGNDKLESYENPDE
jgi:exodeoxyribonuclease VII small subunit